MDATSKKVLKYIMDKKNNPEGAMMFIYFYDAFCDSSGIPEHEAMAALRYLADNGYIKYCSNQNGSDVGFELEHKAYQKAAFTRKAVLTFLGNSIFVPIIVTLLTLIFINLTKDALPPWLQHLLE